MTRHQETEHPESIPVILYSTGWCGECRYVKRTLAELGVGFREVDVDTCPEAAETVMELNDGRRRVPTLLIGGIYYPTGEAIDILRVEHGAGALA
jgi:glutaredoxin